MNQISRQIYFVYIWMELTRDLVEVFVVAKSLRVCLPEKERKGVVTRQMKNIFALNIRKITFSILADAASETLITFPEHSDSQGKYPN